MSPWCCKSRTGLPDGMFSNKKIPFWVNFGGSLEVMEDVGIFYGHLASFSHFGMLYQE
jgi:hypothetical protein